MDFIVEASIPKSFRCKHCQRIFNQSKVIQYAFNNRDIDQDINTRTFDNESTRIQTKPYGFDKIVVDVGEIICICKKIMWVIYFENSVERDLNYKVFIGDMVPIKNILDATPVYLSDAHLDVSKLMLKRKKAYNKLTHKSKNIRFKQFAKIIELFGFVLSRQKGSHRLYYNDETKQRLNIQPNNNDKSKAKPYQVNPLINIIDKYNLLD